MGMDCKYCGAYIASDLDACPACGRKIKEDAPSFVNGNKPGGEEKRYSGYGAYGAGAAAAYAGAEEKREEEKREYNKETSSSSGERREEAKRTYTYKDEYKNRFENHERQSGGFSEEEKRRAKENKYNSVSFENEDDLGTKILAILGYLGPIGLVPFFMGNKQERSFLRFHAIQGLLMTLITIIINEFIGHGLGVILEFAWNIVHFVAAAYCILGIFKGERRKLPILGDIASKDD